MSKQALNKQVGKLLRGGCCASSHPAINEGMKCLPSVMVFVDLDGIKRVALVDSGCTSTMVKLVLFGSVMAILLYCS